MGTSQNPDSRLDPCHKYNKGLLTEREVCAVKHRTEVFSPYYKNRSPIFHGTDRPREVNKLFIIWLAVIFRVIVTFFV